jgi:hypothetical protein
VASAGAGASIGHKLAIGRQGAVFFALVDSIKEINEKA